MNCSRNDGTDRPRPSVSPLHRSDLRSTRARASELLQAKAKRQAKGAGGSGTRCATARASGWIGRAGGGGEGDRVRRTRADTRRRHAGGRGRATGARSPHRRWQKIPLGVRVSRERFLIQDLVVMSCGLAPISHCIAGRPPR